MRYVDLQRVYLLFPTTLKSLRAWRLFCLSGADATDNEVPPLGQTQNVVVLSGRYARIVELCKQ